MPPSDQGRLDNWKDIANYLHRDIRTVQRWEKYEGLPVHRHPGRKSRIFAYESEIAEWWKNRETLAPPGEAAAPIALQESIGRPSVPVNWLASALVLICIMAGILLFGGLMQPIPPGQGHTMDLPDRIFAAADCEGGIVRNVFVKGQPIQLVLSPDLHSLYVLNNVASVGVQVIDLDRYVLSEQIDIPGGVSSIALDRDGATLYLGTLRDGLHIVSRKTGQTRVVRDGISSVVRDLALTRDGKRLYLTLETGGLKRLDLPGHRLATVWTDRCPEFLAMDPAGQYLYVSCGCGPGQSRTHDTIEVMDLATETTVRVLKGPPMVVGSIHLFARGDKLWADGRDACQNQRYRNEAMECPVFPGTIQNIFRLSDSSLVKMIGKPATNPMSDPTFTEDDTGNSRRHTGPRAGYHLLS